MRGKIGWILSREYGISLAEIARRVGGLHFGNRQGHLKNGKAKVTGVSFQLRPFSHKEEPPTFRSLIELENVVCTPHSAGLSREAAYAMAMETVKKIITLFEGKVPQNVLNPEVLKSLKLKE